eukprot:3715596-Pyramimonas_sp.AAC.1
MFALRLPCVVLRRMCVVCASYVRHMCIVFSAVLATIGNNTTNARGPTGAHADRKATRRTAEASGRRGCKTPTAVRQADFTHLPELLQTRGCLEFGTYLCGNFGIQES